MILDLLKFLLALPFTLILPGYFFLLAVFGIRSGKISFFERSALAIPISIISVDLIVLLLDKLGVTLNGTVLIGSIIAFCLVCFVVFRFRSSKKGSSEDSELLKEQEAGAEELYDFSFWQTVFILLSVTVAVFLRVAYLADTIVPSSTDLGHHMYWVQTIINSGHLPNYGMPDFIIGEHIIFAVINLVGGTGVMTAFPALVLLLVNLAGIFTMSILAARLFENRKITAFSIFMIGVLYAISAPQGKYVSGGVVGNVIGNMLIPVVLYFLFRALKEKSSVFAGLFALSFLGLLYTHHLSALILIFSVAGIVAVYVVGNIRHVRSFFFSWLKTFFSPFSLAAMLLGVVFLLFVFTPSYFDPAAVGQATGTPSKSTRVGLGLDQIEFNVGSARFIFGALGLALFAIAGYKKRKEYKYSFAVGWALVLLAMAYKPGWLFINISSPRIGNYLFLPFSLLAAYAVARYFELVRSAATKFFSSVILYAFLFFVITSGLSDSADAFKVKNQFQETVQVYHSARYMADKLNVDKDVILKDHVNVYADSWYKLFFMKDYKYPLSRGNLSRYIDPTNPRETCTRDMISSPESEEGKACYADIRVNYVVLNAQIEGNSFEAYPEFSKVYGSNYISIFRRN